MIEQRLGVKAKTINNALGVVRKILNLATHKWRDKETRLTWLATSPMIEMLLLEDAAKPYPLDPDEQQRLFKLLPDHVTEMSLYKVNTGGREQCQLQWPWEVKIPELGTSVFLIPEWLTKNGDERIHVLNDVAKSVIERAGQCSRPST